MGGQEEQMEPFGDHQTRAFVPPCLIEHQSNVFVGPTADLGSKGAKRERKGLDIDCGHHQPACLAAFRFHKAIEIHPLIALPHDRLDCAPFAGPHAPQDRFEPNAMFVTAPQFHRCFWMGLTNQFYLLGQFF